MQVRIDPQNRKIYFLDRAKGQHVFTYSVSFKIKGYSDVFCVNLDNEAMPVLYHCYGGDVAISPITINEREMIFVTKDGMLELLNPEVQAAYKEAIIHYRFEQEFLEDKCPK